MQRLSSKVTGFTLIELLVVVAIVGLLITFAGLTIGSTDNVDESLQENASSLVSQMSMAEASAVLSGQPVGMHLMPPTNDQDGWQLKWSRWQNLQWRQSSTRLAQLSLPSDLPLQLEVDGLMLDLHEQSRSQQISENVLPLPSLVFYPTGETSQFTLRLGLDDADSLQIGNTSSGTIEISEIE